MKRDTAGRLVFSPSDLIVFLQSPFASWMDRHRLESPDCPKPDGRSRDQELVAKAGNRHEEEVLRAYREAGVHLCEIEGTSFADALAKTREALDQDWAMIYQGALAADRFAGYADFIERNGDVFQVWDTKLARSPKPFFAIQLCCYSEMLAATLGIETPRQFGVILGDARRMECRTEDYIHYYRRAKRSFLALQDAYDGDVAKRPEPLARGEHGQWESLAEAWLAEQDHLIQVAGITVGQIKKLHRAGIRTVDALASAPVDRVERMARETFAKLVEQARLQCECRQTRAAKPGATPPYRVLPTSGTNGQPTGLAKLPPADDADVFFDMEGYPLVPGGLEYLFGAAFCDESKSSGWAFKAWWAHDRAEEKAAFEGFVDWVYARWQASPGMHVYHYAEYEISAIRRLSTRHDTRQDEVDDLLRNEVFVDLYDVVRTGLRVGEDSYSLKKIEHLYYPVRQGEVSTSVGSIVAYADFLANGEPRGCEDWERTICTCQPGQGCRGGDYAKCPDSAFAQGWQAHPIRHSIREYNEEDCISTGELARWLRERAAEQQIPARPPEPLKASDEKPEQKEIWERRQAILKELAARDDEIARLLTQLGDFHRRENKPKYWRLFDRAAASEEQLIDDAGCLAGLVRFGEPVPDKMSQIQTYRYDPSQETKLAAGSDVMFAQWPKPTLKIHEMDPAAGMLKLRMSNKGLEKVGCEFPVRCSLIPQEIIGTDTIRDSLTEICGGYLTEQLPMTARALLERRPPQGLAELAVKPPLQAALEVARTMYGDCLVIQGPPGCGKTYTASKMIADLLAQGKRVGITSNSHHAINNLMAACGKTMRQENRVLTGIKVRSTSESDLPVFQELDGIVHVQKPDLAFGKYAGGLIGGTAWLFSRPEWKVGLDFLFIDEAGQVSLANAVAVTRCAQNLVLMGDQMQLEQPTEGAHPGDSNLSVLQYALKDLERSGEDDPVFHPVVPSNKGIFLAETYRMHPDVCRFISESIYDGRLGSHDSCQVQRVECSGLREALAHRTPLDERLESGIVFCGVEHEGNVQSCDEEAACCREAYESLLGSTFRDKEGRERPLELEDFLFMAPYNAQVRALQAVLPPGAKVGSVDKFQGQEAPVCILSMCSSFGEYGSRGLGFILDRNRLNVAISRAKCLAVVVADPRIAVTSVNSLEEMRLVNLFCKLSEPG